MRNNLSDKSKELLNSIPMMRQTLSQVFNLDMVNHIMELIVKDEAHEKLLRLTTEDQS